MKFLSNWLDKRRKQKCEEQGHPTQTYTEKYWCRPKSGTWNFFRSVLELVTVEVTECECGAIRNEEERNYREGYQSVSWSQEMWEELNKEGRVNQ